MYPRYSPSCCWTCAEPHCSSGPVKCTQGYPCTQGTVHLIVGHAQSLTAPQVLYSVHNDTPVHKVQSILLLDMRRASLPRRSCTVYIKNCTHKVQYTEYSMHNSDGDTVHVVETLNIKRNFVRLKMTNTK